MHAPQGGIRPGICGAHVGGTAEPFTPHCACAPVGCQRSHHQQHPAFSQPTKAGARGLSALACARMHAHMQALRASSMARTLLHKAVTPSPPPMVGGASPPALPTPRLLAGWAPGCRRCCCSLLAPPLELLLLLLPLPS